MAEEMKPPHDENHEMVTPLRKGRRAWPLVLLLILAAAVSGLYLYSKKLAVVYRVANRGAGQISRRKVS